MLLSHHIAAMVQWLSVPSGVDPAAVSASIRATSFLTGHALSQHINASLQLLKFLPNDL